MLSEFRRLDPKRACGRHKFDIRFWREGERTEFEVLNGNASLVERCEMGVKAAQLTDRTEPI